MDRRIVAPTLVAATKLCISLTLLWTGFRSISDDDFARVTIAQHFAVHPRLDPSGTSWLPFPFWVYGGAMKAFGIGLVTAELVAVLLGVCGAIGVWLAARVIGLSPRAALIAGLLGACIPHAAYYGTAMVPDYPTAVLALAASTTLVSTHGPTRFAGALAACAATLSRYETWPIALVVATYALIDQGRPHRGQVSGSSRQNPVADADPTSPLRTARELRLWLLGSALVAPSGALAWMCHGVANHHDPFFFLKRVAAYRRALGENSLPFGMRLAKQPLALFTGEPELVVALICLLLAVWLVHGRARLEGSSWQRPLVGLASVVACLVVGDLLDGAPTHHEDRVLLSVWLGCALGVGALTDRLFCSEGANAATGSRKPRSQWLALSAVVLAATGVACLVRPLVTRDESYVDRSREVRAGQLAAGRIPSGQKLALYTTDYGFFAIQAAFARPLDAAPLSRHDPRQRDIDPFSTNDELIRQLDALGASYLVVPATHRQKASSLALVSPIAESPSATDFVVLMR